VLNYLLFNHKIMLKKLIVLSITFLLFISTSSASSFSDVPQDNIAINWLSENNIINGYEDGTFKPDQTVNRAEFLKILYEILESDISETSTYMFEDVPHDAWYGKYLYLAYMDGAIEGYPDGTFRPENPINFAEAFKIIQRSFFYEWDPDDSWMYWHKYVPCYKDLGASNWDQWYWGYIHYLDNLCIIPERIANYGEEFEAGRSLTRLDTAELLYRAKSVRDNSHYEDFMTLFSKYNTEMVPKQIGSFSEPEGMPVFISIPYEQVLDPTTNYSAYVLPSKYVCNEDNISPSFEISVYNTNVKSIAIVARTYDSDEIIWLMWNITPEGMTVEENQIPVDAVQGTNSFGTVGYHSPCPEGDSTEYVFNLYGLDIELELDSSATIDDFTSAIENHILVEDASYRSIIK